VRVRVRARARARARVRLVGVRFPSQRTWSGVRRFLVRTNSERSPAGTRSMTSTRNSVFCKGKGLGWGVGVG
jgi:hypothetical protein